MNDLNIEGHSFHIPVMGLAYTVDTPAKIAKYGISSVVSIIEDNLIEQMREYYCSLYNFPYEKINEKIDDFRAKRITAYLNILNDVALLEFKKLQVLDFLPGNDLTRYFQLLPDKSSLKELYIQMMETKDNAIKLMLQKHLKSAMTIGSIDVNIMTKCDRPAGVVNGEKLPDEYSDALSALRGYAKSNLASSIVFSAGLNPRLFSYCSTFKDFIPDELGHIKKQIILKVSDYRSAFIQGKYLASKGLWVSEFRVESGINCGGHTFLAEGQLMGPILSEFDTKKQELFDQIHEVYTKALESKNHFLTLKRPMPKITAQGGIGACKENAFLLEHYHLSSTGWGSPFLLVPEVTNVDDDTLQRLVHAKKEDYYLSNASPLGVPISNFRKSTSEEQRLRRIKSNRPGSPCYKKFLSFSNEFGEPLCTASRKFQNLKLEKLKEQKLNAEEYNIEHEKIIEKDCLCEGLGSSALLKNHLKPSHKLTAVSICPGPNLAYFSKVMTLENIVDHIYGRKNQLNLLKRKHVFINELELYVNYLLDEIKSSKNKMDKKKEQYFINFKQNLSKGIDYYFDLVPQLKKELGQGVYEFQNALRNYSKILQETTIPIPQSV